MRALSVNIAIAGNPNGFAVPNDSLTDRGDSFALPGLDALRLGLVFCKLTKT